MTSFDKPDRGEQEWDVPLNEALDYLEAHAAAEAQEAKIAAQAEVGTAVDAAKDRTNHTGTQDASTVTGLFEPASTDGKRVTEPQLDPAVRALLSPGYQSAWNLQPHLELGAYQFWVDAAGGLRIKVGAPTSDTDGTALGYTNPDPGGGTGQPDPATLYPSVYGYGSTAPVVMQAMRNVVASAIDSSRVMIADDLPLDTAGITGIRRTISGPGIATGVVNVATTSRSTAWMSLTAGVTYTLTSAALYGTEVGPVTTRTATPTATTTPPPPPPPPVLSANTQSSTTIRLTWTA